jgi:CRISPR-associated protein Cas1
MATLYITEAGARLEKEYQRLLVVRDDEVLTAVPLSHVSEVVLVGWVGTTTPAMLALLDAGVGLTLAQRGGKLRGRLRPAEGGNVPLRRQQYLRTGEPAFALEVSRAIVAGKIYNARTLALRIVRTRKAAHSPGLAGLEAQFARLEQAGAQVAAAADAASLRGLEGSAARVYFAILRDALKWQGDHPFEKRVRRPPRDPVNALLSLGYTLLTGAVFTAIEVAGLDPYAGFFHAEKYGRPALALDLVEEFRPLVVDSVVLTLVNKRMLAERDFEFGEEGVFLTSHGMRVFLRQFARRLGETVQHPLAGKALSYQKIFEVQARQLRKVIEGQAPVYIPFRTR